jgi:hypothetical protein
MAALAHSCKQLIQLADPTIPSDRLDSLNHKELLSEAIQASFVMAEFYRLMHEVPIARADSSTLKVVPESLLQRYGVPTEKLPTFDSNRHDSSQQNAKRIIHWNGLDIGITHRANQDVRYGNRMQGVSYGHIRRSWGSAEDGKALDVYLGPNLQSTKLFKLRQLNPGEGTVDETKYGVGFETAAEFKDAYQRHLPLSIKESMFGGIEEIPLDELQAYRSGTHLDGCGCEQCQTKQERLDIIRKNPKTQKFELWSKDGSQLLGEHDSYEAAMQQEAAIAASKKRQHADNSEETGKGEWRYTEDGKRIWVKRPDVENGGYWKYDPRSRNEDTQKTPGIRKLSVSNEFISKLKFLPYREFDKGQNAVTFATDPKGNALMIKAGRTRNVTNEILASEIGAAEHISLNKIRVLPKEPISRRLPSGYIVQENQAASLHYLVPGVPMSNDVDTMEAISDRTPEGLARNYFFQFAGSHPDLAKIQALDILIGNSDRHHGNVYYDESTDSYHGIDHSELEEIGPAHFVSKALQLYQSRLENNEPTVDLLGPNPEAVKNNIKTFFTQLEHLSKKYKPSQMTALRTDLAAQVNPGQSFDERAERAAYVKEGAEFDRDNQPLIRKVLSHKRTFE